MLRPLLILISGLVFSNIVLAEPTWKWVKANNLIDKWAMEEGMAEVRISKDAFEAKLYKPDNLQTVYIKLSGTIDKNWIVASHNVTNAGRGFNKFRGPRKSSHWKGFEEHTGVETITLTDGWSMIGLTRGIAAK
ncbi:MAG TPA: hypothetical protein VFF74_01745 [Methylophilaceae bacterium]|nr:hypothetical protein [Methylophilaceae bacterium]